MATIEDIDNLLSRVALHDRSAFKELYSSTSAKLFGICLRILNDRAAAEDALQEIFVKVWHNADRYRPGRASPMSWLIAVARNHSIDRLRSRQAGDEELAEAELEPDSGPTPEATAIARSEAGRITACLDELDGARADAVRGAYLDGLSYAELSERHDVPLNTMRTWLRRSLTKLRECISR